MDLATVDIIVALPTLCKLRAGVRVFIELRPGSRVQRRTVVDLGNRESQLYQYGSRKTSNFKCISRNNEIETRDTYQSQRYRDGDFYSER